MKSLMLLWQAAANELAARCGTSTTQDFEEVVRRCEHEGLSFLTIALPAFASDFQKSLDRGWVGSDLFLGFKRKGGLPLFLGGFLCLVFDRGSGRLLDDPNVEAVFAIRQLTLLTSKLFLPTTKRRETAAMRGFIECEKNVKIADAVRTDSEKDQFRQVSRLLWGDVLHRMSKDLFDEDRGATYHQHGGEWPVIIPKHGPGATADRLEGNHKFDQREWTQRLEEVFPSGEYLLPSWRHYNRLDRVDILEPGAERPVRVVAVPKTMKTPRIIAIEPTCMQYMQQGLKRNLVRHIENDSLMGRIVGFTDQKPNRRMACEGSSDGSLATLDLSEASDRVSNQLVRLLLERYPLVFKAVDATRSRRADVLGHGVIRLAKFASMGSALTFPVEAMVFATVVFVGIQKELNRQLTKKDVKSLLGRVRIYGDDIIVPSRFVPSVVRTLTDFGFVVNSGKSFWTGKFRESCGREYFDGHDVSIVKVRKMFPTRRESVSEMESLVTLRNLFYLRGMWLTARHLDSVIQPLLTEKGRTYFPCVEVSEIDPEEDLVSRSALLGRSSFLGYQTQKLHRDYQSPLVRGWYVKSLIPSNQASGVGSLLKVLSKRSEEPFEDAKHLERSGRPEAVRISLQWSSPF